MPEPVIEAIVATLTSRLAVTLADPAERPHKFVRDIYNHWKEAGGTLAGKTRHSDRFLDEELRKRNKQVRSLNPKLAAARTNLQPMDADILIKYFLENWPVHPRDDVEEVRYRAILEPEEVRQLASYLTDQIVRNPDDKSTLAIIQPEDDKEDPVLPGEDIAALVIRNFEDCDALVTVAPEHVLIAAYPKTELIGFKGLIDRLWAVERRDKKARPLVWILDSGERNIDDFSSRKKYLNIQSLISRFKALTRFTDANTDKRIEWLRSRAVIAILDIDEQEFSPERSLTRRPPFAAHHVSLTTTANEWLADSRFRALYGSALQDLDQRNFSVFFRQEPWPGIDSQLKYLGYALFKPAQGQSDFIGRGLELPTLPSRYTMAFKTVCASAFHELGMDEKAHDLIGIDGQEASDRLQYLGFSILSLEMFLKRF